MDVKEHEKTIGNTVDSNDVLCQRGVEHAQQEDHIYVYRSHPNHCVDHFLQ